MEHGLVGLCPLSAWWPPCAGAGLPATPSSGSRGTRADQGLCPASAPQRYYLLEADRLEGGGIRPGDGTKRLLTQMERILEINALHGVTKAVVAAARESLVIGED